MGASEKKPQRLEFLNLRVKNEKYHKSDYKTNKKAQNLKNESLICSVAGEILTNTHKPFSTKYNIITSRHRSCNQKVVQIILSTNNRVRMIGHAC